MALNLTFIRDAETPAGGVISDRLVALALDAERAGLRAAALQMAGLARVVLGSQQRLGQAGVG